MVLFCYTPYRQSQDWLRYRDFYKIQMWPSPWLLIILFVDLPFLFINVLNNNNNTNVHNIIFCKFSSYINNNIRARNWHNIKYKLVYDSFFMVECYSPLFNTMRYYGNSSSPGAHFPFNFLLINAFNQQSDAYDVDNVIKSWMLNMPEGQWPNWVVSVWYYTQTVVIDVTLYITGRLFYETKIFSVNSYSTIIWGYPFIWT